jgi:hypothetical protein
VSTLKPINSDKYVLLANSMKAKINGIREINLCNKQIKNDLYLKIFPVNILSTNKLTQKLNCDAICSFKILHFKTGKQTSRLEKDFLKIDTFFNIKLNFCASAKFVNSHLWHKRFWHPSDNILNSILDLNFLNCTNCEICKLAKQTMPHFSFFLLAKVKLLLI